MWESPIDITEDTHRMSLKMREDIDGRIIWEVERAIGIHVDKQELLNALKYSKDQFDKGYAEGQRAWRNITDCGHCRYNKAEFTDALCECSLGNNIHLPEGFCSRGEPRDEDSIDSASCD